MKLGSKTIDQMKAVLDQNYNFTKTQLPSTTKM